MRQLMCVVAPALLMAACNKGPEVDLKNASVNEVAEAVKQSGMSTGDTMIEPGLWESKVTVLEMNIPGIPPEYAEKMKASLAAHRGDTNSHCVTPEEVKKPKEDFFGADKSCRYEHFTMGNGKIDIQMACNHDGAAQTTSMTGTYTPTTYAMDMASSGSAGAQGNMSMKMHVDSKRVGECSANQG